jgi:hypothetical protein
MCLYQGGFSGLFSYSAEKAGFAVILPAGSMIPCNPLRQGGLRHNCGCLIDPARHKVRADIPEVYVGNMREYTEKHKGLSTCRNTGYVLYVLLQVVRRIHRGQGSEHNYESTVHIYIQYICIVLYIYCNLLRE